MLLITSPTCPYKFRIVFYYPYFFCCCCVAVVNVNSPSQFVFEAKWNVIRRFSLRIIFALLYAIGYLSTALRLSSPQKVFIQFVRAVRYLGIMSGLYKCVRPTSYPRFVFLLSFFLLPSTISLFLGILSEIAGNRLVTRAFSLFGFYETQSASHILT